jgi:hypothetical protein
VGRPILAAAGPLAGWNEVGTFFGARAGTPLPVHVWIESCSTGAGVGQSFPIEKFSLRLFEIRGARKTVPTRSGGGVRRNHEQHHGHEPANGKGGGKAENHAEPEPLYTPPHVAMVLTPGVVGPAAIFFPSRRASRLGPAKASRYE